MPQFTGIDPRQFSLLVHTHPSPILLDVRTPPEFEGVHAVGARNMPLETIKSSTLFNSLKIHRDCPVYLICERGSRAKVAAGAFVEAGFTSISIIEGGTIAWIADGYPVVSSGKKSLSIERQVRIGAGGLVLVGIILSLTVYPGFLALSAFVGAGLLFAGITDCCGIGLLLVKAPWNR